jgi:hypothetical protein
VIRTILAAAAIITALTAAAATYRHSTCGCDDPTMPYDTVAIVAAITSIILFAAYAVSSRITRSPND